MKQTYAPTDRLYEAAKELQKNDPNLPFNEALNIAAKSEDARRSPEQGQNTSGDDEPEDWQAELDRRYDAAKAYQEANPEVSFEQAMIETARQADQGNPTAFSRQTKMTADQLAEYDRKNAAKIAASQAEVEKARRDGRLTVHRV